MILERKDTFEETLKTYKRYIQVCAYKINRDEFKDDLIAEAIQGLYNAYNSFNKEKGTFHSLAQYNIKYAMVDFITNNSRTIRLPSNAQYNPIYKVEEVKCISTSLPIGNDNDTIIADTLPSNDMFNDYDNSNDVIKDVLSHYLSKLNDRHSKVLKMRYIESMTYLEISNVLLISEEAVRLQINTALKNIRKLMGITVKNNNKYIRVK